MPGPKAKKSRNVNRYRVGGMTFDVVKPGIPLRVRKLGTANELARGFNRPNLRETLSVKRKRGKFKSTYWAWDAKTQKTVKVYRLAKMHRLMHALTLRLHARARLGIKSQSWLSYLEEMVIFPLLESRDEFSNGSHTIWAREQRAIVLERLRQHSAIDLSLDGKYTQLLVHSFHSRKELLQAVSELFEDVRMRPTLLRLHQLGKKDSPQVWKEMNKIMDYFAAKADEYERIRERT